MGGRMDGWIDWYLAEGLLIRFQKRVHPCLIKQAVFISITQLHYHERAAITDHNNPLYPSVVSNRFPAAVCGFSFQYQYKSHRYVSKCWRPPRQNKSWMTSKTWWSTTPDILQRYDLMNCQTDTYFCNYCTSGSHKGLYRPGVLRTQWNGNDACNTKVRLWNDQTKTTTQICDRNAGKEINRNVLTWQSKGFGCTTNTKQGYRVFYMSYLWRLYDLWLAQTQIMSWSALSLSDDAFVRSAKVQ